MKDSLWQDNYDFFELREDMELVETIVSHPMANVTGCTIEHITDYHAIFVGKLNGNTFVLHACDEIGNYNMIVNDTTFTDNDIMVLYLFKLV